MLQGVSRVSDVTGSQAFIQHTELAEADLLRDTEDVPLTGPVIWWFINSSNKQLYSAAQCVLEIEG